MTAPTEKPDEAATDSRNPELVAEIEAAETMADALRQNLAEATNTFEFEGHNAAAMHHEGTLIVICENGGGTSGDDPFVLIHYPERTLRAELIDGRLELTNEDGFPQLPNHGYFEVRRREANRITTMVSEAKELPLSDPCVKHLIESQGEASS